MGICRFCRQPAGIFRSEHRACAERHTNALRRVQEAAFGCATGLLPDSDLEPALAEARNTSVSDADLLKAKLDGWAAAVDHFLNDGDLSAEEEELLSKVDTALGLPLETVVAHPAHLRVVHGAALREILSGQIPTRQTGHEHAPFNLQKNEQLIWLFYDTEYLEDKVRREYVGRSAGVSVRVMKGVYVRSGSFRGTPVERTERTSVDLGTLGVTNRHVYFAGPRKSFRVRHDKIVSHMPFSDGVGIVRDAQTAKRQIFVTGHGWFTYNLFVNVARL